MARNEPTLVPEWLRGVGGSGHHGALSQHAGVDGGPHFARQRQGSHLGSHGDGPEFSRHGPALERPFFRRGGGGPALSDRDVHARDSQGRTSYASFNRGSYRNYDGGDRERDSRSARISGERDREYHRDRDKDRSSGSGNSDRLESVGSGQRHVGSNEATGLRRSLSSASGSRFQDENRETERRGSEGAGIPAGIPPASTTSKAAFDRNFPSLNAAELQSSSAAQDAALSPGVGPRQLSRAASASAIAPSGGSGDAWTTVFIEVQGGAAGATSGPASPSPTPPGSAGVTSSALPGGGAVAPAAALDRVRAAPQVPGETQRLEELALKQSRQLVPMKPTMPKALTQGPTARDKGKAKPGRLGEGPLLPPALIASAPSSPNLPFRLSQGGRGDPSKPLTGVLLGRRLGKEGGSTAGTGSSATRPEGGLVPLGPVPLGGSAAVALSSPAGPAAGPPSASTSSGSGPRPRGAGQAAHAGFPAGGASGTGIVRPKDPPPGPGAEEKKGSLHTQNRSDFFNALRRKAAGGGAAAGSGGAVTAEKQGSGDEVETKEAAQDAVAGERGVDHDDLGSLKPTSATVAEHVDESRPSQGVEKDSAPNSSMVGPAQENMLSGKALETASNSWQNSLGGEGAIEVTSGHDSRRDEESQRRMNGSFDALDVLTEKNGKRTEPSLDTRKQAWEKANGTSTVAEALKTSVSEVTGMAPSMGMIRENGASPAGQHDLCASASTNLEAHEEPRARDSWSEAVVEGVPRLHSDESQAKQQNLIQQNLSLEEAGEAQDFSAGAKLKAGVEDGRQTRGSIRQALEGTGPGENGTEASLQPASQATPAASERPRDIHPKEGGGVKATSAGSSSMGYVPFRAASMEEEEAAFLRSLGWTEEAEEGEENALTEEEISAFYKEAGKVAQRGQWQIRTAAFRASPHGFSALRPSMRAPNGACRQERALAGSLGSLSSGMTSSDSESDDEHAFQPRRQR